MHRVLLACAFLALAVPAFAEEEAEDKPHDAEGCKDSPLLSRMPESLIGECSDKEYDEAEIPSATGAEGGPVQKVYKGAVTRIRYVHKKGQSAVQIVKNYQDALKRAGFKTIYTESANGGTNRTVTSERKGAGAAVVSVLAESGGEEPPRSDLTIVRLKEMEQEIVADASSLLEELNRSGRVSVYGINFDTGKASIKADSAKVLEQVSKLLNDNAELKLRVEGHTDNQGKAKENLELSKKRAAAVKEWLVKNGVPAPRLTTEGLGDKKPVEDNKSEEGRAKNRRVELVKL
jgi:outer membrane protein OmpA-like peptidoglycan-associated protein